jgi:hypothetical protein
MNFAFLNADVSEESREWTGLVEVRYGSFAIGLIPSPLAVTELVDMETIVNFIEELDVNTTHLHFECITSSTGALEDMPSLERFHHLMYLSLTDFCDLTAAPRIYVECVGIHYSLKFTMSSVALYDTYPTGDWNVLIICNWFIERLHWPRNLNHMVLINCEIRDVSPPEGGSFVGGTITTFGCDFINPFYEEMWNTRVDRRVERYGIQLNALDHLVSLDNFALMRECVLNEFACLAGKVGVAVDVTNGDVSKINSASALASNVLRRAAEFVYF